MRTELGVALLFVACNAGPPNPTEACKAIAHAWCHRVWELSSQGCADATGIAASFASQQQCEDTFEYDKATCDKVSCAPLGYSPSHANECTRTAGSLTCTPDIARERDSCPSICCELEGASVGTSDECCSGSAHQIGGYSCGGFYVEPSLICD